MMVLPYQAGLTGSSPSAEGVTQPCRNPDATLAQPLRNAEIPLEIKASGRINLIPRLPWGAASPT
ncbi:hypothetical protein ACQR0Z_32965 [Bradyrhizobium sp. HKCCYLS3077]|uniref:hypothetical protein n=1 Tax=Bradyrhizobium sp. HKCCYLS3077 TaxID=3420761 RepID=UPI003EB84EBD